LPDFWRLPDSRHHRAGVESRSPAGITSSRRERRGRINVVLASGAIAVPSSRTGRERRLLWQPSMRRHHEAAASAIVTALVMVIPVAGGLWARWTSLQRSVAAPEKAAEADHEREA
jgi:hypothetical protein